MKTKLMKARHWFSKWCKGHDTLVNWTWALFFAVIIAVVVLKANEIYKAIPMF